MAPHRFMLRWHKDRREVDGGFVNRFRQLPLLGHAQEPKPATDWFGASGVSLQQIGASVSRIDIDVAFEHFERSSKRLQDQARAPRVDARN